ncbi:hypothetical protein HH1059_13820 [Halorhodospira halochloris]|uniref:Uncharacterized protein n=1 Tax=Halorhodospira halochloris TaxID=1052 RepID=A0A2Z6EZI2_HALHR|nr:hypothetical protein HH1059_13820 [Halorhodospira halochloris]
MDGAGVRLGGQEMQAQRCLAAAGGRLGCGRRAGQETASKISSSGWRPALMRCLLVARGGGISHLSSPLLPRGLGGRHA